VGAYDGIDGSNSRQLAVEGWNAVLIEPVPSAYAELRKNCSGFPNVRLLNVACSDTGGRATMHVTEGQESSLSYCGLSIAFNGELKWTGKQGRLEVAWGFPL